MKTLYLIAQKTYRVNLQYKYAQLLNAMGSALFGYIMVFVWKAATKNSNTVEIFTTYDLVQWVAFAQFMFNFIYARAGLQIQRSVRSGNISLELLRPTSFFLYVLSREFGFQCYNAVYRCFPILVLYSTTLGYKTVDLTQFILLIIAILLASYIYLCISYIIGLTSLWTTDIRWSHYLSFAAFNIASGIMIPVAMLGGLFGKIAAYSPWACLFNPACLIYLNLHNSNVLKLPIIWAILLTLFCLVLTYIGRKKLEVQGG